MKNYFYLTCFLLLSFYVSAQVPQGFNYQAAVRDNVGDLMISQAVTLQFDIISGTANGPVVYRETHDLTTNEHGLVNTVIGQGTPVIGTFDAISWGDNSFFLKVSLNGTDLGTTQFMSVPYAMAAGSVPEKEHIIAIPSSAFTSRQNTSDAAKALGNGGAHILSGSDALVAPVIIPDGAVITELTFYYIDDSAEDLTIALYREGLSGYFSLVETFTTTGTDVNYRSETFSNVNHTVNSEFYGYFIRVSCTDWSGLGDKKIQGVRIKYTY